MGHDRDLISSDVTKEITTPIGRNLVGKKERKSMGISWRKEKQRRENIEGEKRRRKKEDQTRRRGQRRGERREERKVEKEIKNVKLDR